MAQNYFFKKKYYKSPNMVILASVKFKDGTKKKARPCEDDRPSIVSERERERERERARARVLRVQHYTAPVHQSAQKA